MGRTRVAVGTPVTRRPLHSPGRAVITQIMINLKKFNYPRYRITIPLIFISIPLGKKFFFRFDHKV